MPGSSRDCNHVRRALLDFLDQALSLLVAAVLGKRDQARVLRMAERERILLIVNQRKGTIGHLLGALLGFGRVDHVVDAIQIRDTFLRFRPSRTLAARTLATLSSSRLRDDAAALDGRHHTVNGILGVSLA